MRFPSITQSEEWISKREERGRTVVRVPTERQDAVDMERWLARHGGKHQYRFYPAEYEQVVHTNTAYGPGEQIYAASIVVGFLNPNDAMRFKLTFA